jgi:hypothetical protein
MAYFCYVYREDGDVPYMEVLSEIALEAAQDRAMKLLDDRPHWTAAEIFYDSEPLARLTREELSWAPLLR